MMRKLHELNFFQVWEETWWPSRPVGSPLTCTWMLYQLATPTLSLGSAPHPAHPSLVPVSDDYEMIRCFPNAHQTKVKKIYNKKELWQNSEINLLDSHATWCQQFLFLLSSCELSFGPCALPSGCSGTPGLPLYHQLSEGWPYHTHSCLYLLLSGCCTTAGTHTCIAAQFQPIT